MLGAPTLFWRLRARFFASTGPFEPQTKKSLSNARLFRSWPLELARPASILGRPDGPEVDFGGRNASIFELSRPAHAFGANFVRTQQNTIKRGTGRTSELSRDKTKTTKNRSASAFDDPRCFDRARMRFGTVLGRLGTRPGALLDRPRPPRARPGRPKIAPRAVFGRPEPVPSESRRVLETALNAQNRPRSNFR